MCVCVCLCVWLTMQEIEEYTFMVFTLNHCENMGFLYFLVVFVRRQIEIMSVQYKRSAFKHYVVFDRPPFHTHPNQSLYT